MFLVVVQPEIWFGVSIHFVDSPEIFDGQIFETCYFNVTNFRGNLNSLTGRHFFEFSRYFNFGDGQMQKITRMPQN